MYPYVLRNDVMHTHLPHIFCIPSLQQHDLPSQQQHIAPAGHTAARSDSSTHAGVPISILMMPRTCSDPHTSLSETAAEVGLPAGSYSYCCWAVSMLPRPLRERQKTSFDRRHEYKALIRMLFEVRGDALLPGPDRLGLTIQLSKQHCTPTDKRSPAIETR
jgi:hypothetical protein